MPDGNVILADIKEFKRRLKVDHFQYSRRVRWITDFMVQDNYRFLVRLNNLYRKGMAKCRTAR